MDPKETREKAIRDAKCGLILDAAKQVFARKGFHATRLEDIAEAAGFSKASLYNYYDSKELIFISLADREYDRLIQELDRAVSVEAPLIDNLRTAMGIIFKGFGEHFALMLEISDVRCMSAEHFKVMAAHHADLVSGFKTKQTAMQSLFLGMVSNGRGRAEFSTDMSDADCARFIGSIVRGIMMDWKRAGQLGNAEQEIGLALSFIAHGLRVGG